jgi:hypothetical protein
MGASLRELCAVTAISIVPSSRVLTSSGDAKIGLTRDPAAHDRMRAVLTFRDVAGRGVVVELAPSDLRGILHDALKLVSADNREVRGWWAALTADERPATVESRR